MVDQKAPPGKFRVVGVDTFDGTDWIVGDFTDRGDALAVAQARAGTMLKMHVYDDAGHHLGDAGTF